MRSEPESIGRRALRALRFALPGPRTLLRIRRIRRSGLFDRTYYVDTNPGMRRLFRLMPERHYVMLGEPAGLRPAPRFDPRAYLDLNPDLASLTSQTGPFEHWIRHGRQEARLTERPMPVSAGTHLPPPPVAPHRRRSDLAAAVHVFYPELWEGIAARLHAARDALGEAGPDLLVTITDRGDETTALAEAIARDFPGAHVTRLPNRGRDMGPFAYLAASGALSGYAAICKLHTKRSPHLPGGELWREELMDGLLEPGALGRRLAAFQGDPRAGLWVADGYRMGPDRWGANRAATAALLERAGRRAEPARLAFPAGSIYWVKPGPVRALSELGLDWFDFEPEAAQLDGTLAHALERAMGYLVSDLGLEIRETSELDGAARAGRAGGHV